MYRIQIFLFFIFSLIFYSCSNYAKIGLVNVAQTYSPQNSELQPELHVVHTDNHYSLVTIEIPSSDLFYFQKASENYYTSIFQLSIRVFDANNDALLFQMDTAITDTLQNDPLRIIRQPLKIPLAIGKDYHIHVRFEDLRKRRSADRIIHADKSSLYSRGFFSFFHKNSAKNLQNLIQIPPKEKYTFQHSTQTDFKVLIRRIVYPDQIASPPFASENTPLENFSTWAVDTAFSVLMNERGNACFELPKYGLYHFSQSGNTESGFLIKSFWSNFPNLPEDENSLNPLRYITTQQEFENLFTFGEPTLAMEKFWNKITGNPDRAISLQTRYNHRVVEANKLFSSFLPGWQTDRGMIYIVFGPPDKVNLTSTGESWQYNEQLNIPKLHFEFQKYENPFAETHMLLKRNPVYRNSWNIALERWRR
jgi:GWxTD domain-containing protein